MTQSPMLLPGYDVFFYWSASYAARQGQNPYDAEIFRTALNVAGFPVDQFDLFPNPPWSFWLFYWFSFLPFEVARILWLVAILTIAFSSVRSIIDGWPGIASSFPQTQKNKDKN